MGLFLQNIDFEKILTKIKLELILSNVAVLFATDLNVGNCKSLSLAITSLVLPKLAPAHYSLFHLSSTTF